MMQLGLMWIMVQCVIGIKKVISTSFTQTTPFIDHEGYSQCGGVQLFGGYQIFDLSTGIVKLFNLPPHYKLYLSFVVYIIDTLNESILVFLQQSVIINIIIYCMTSSQAINIQVDQASTQTIIPMSSTNLCGSYQADQTYNIVINQFHSYPTAIISIFSSIDSSNVYWGIRDFELSVDTCPYGCQICFQESQVFECFQWKLFHSSWNIQDINDFDNNGWLATSVTGPTECASIPIYGGYNSMTVGGQLQRTFQLPPHSNLFFIFRFVKIDNWSGEFENQDFKVLYNGVGTQKNFCGNSMYPDQFHIHGIEFVHDAPTITILIASEQYNSDRFYGIRDFYIYGYTFPSYCGDGIIDDNEQCDDGNIYAFDGCFNCQYSCIEGCSTCLNEICLNCQDGWIFDIFNDQCIYQQFNNLEQQIMIQQDQQKVNINNQLINCIQFNQEAECIQCKIGYELFEDCQTICGDGIVSGILQIQLKIKFIYLLFIINLIIIIIIDISNYNEQCEIPQKNCNSSCQYQCYRINIQQYKLQEECIQCNFGQCQLCRDGYVLQMYECIPKCGDYQVERQEQCDDGNMIRFDGCNNCNNECQDSCILCEFGQCIMCKQGWILENGYCISKCGDNMIALGLEECDDGNDIQFDGCYNCKLECPDQGCSVCFLGVCYNCNYPLTLYKDQCLVICGDGLLAYGYEDCDDGNDIPYDGCYKCKYNQNECKICDKGICMDECDYGYYLINQICVSQCGDGILTYDEQCDDGNSIEYDGCHLCNYSCPQNCQICEEGIDYIQTYYLYMLQMQFWILYRQLIMYYQMWRWIDWIS